MDEITDEEAQKILAMLSELKEDIVKFDMLYRDCLRKLNLKLTKIELLAKKISK